jgi:hypothetical protein
MLSLSALNEPLAALRRRGPRGLDVQAPVRPEQPAPLAAPTGGTNWGATVGQLVGAAAFGKSAKPETPTFSSAADSARAQQGPGLTQPGTKFLDTAQLDITGALKSKARRQFMAPPVQTFAGGGTLKRPGEVAVVGEEGPEVAVRGEGGATHVIPLSAVEEMLRGFGQSQATSDGGGGETRPRRAEPGQIIDRARGVGLPVEEGGMPQPPVTTAPPGLPLSVLDGLKGSPVEQAMAPDGAPSSVVPRPRMVSPRDETPDEARRAGLEGQIEVEREHPEQGGRGLKTTLLSAALGALQGLGATGSWEGAAGGAGAGAAANLIDPKILPELQRQRREAGYKQEIGQIGERQEAALERAGKVAGVRKTVAETERILHPAVKPDVQIVKGRGGYYAVDKNNVSSEPVRLPIDPDDPDKPPTMFDWMGQRMTVVSDGQGGWKAEPLAGVPVDESEVPVVEDGLPVKPGTALSARATREQREYQHGRDAKRDADDAAQATYLDEKGRFENVQSAVTEFNKLVTEGEKARRALQTLSQIKDPDADTQAQISVTAALHDSLMKQVAEGEEAIDATYAVKGADGRFRMKAEPRRRTPPTQRVSSPPAASSWGEDPDVRAYADAHFRGDYGAAQLAIEEQKKRRR